SLTCSMLFGWNSESSSFLWPAPSGDFTCIPRSAGSAPATPAATTVPSHRLRFISLIACLRGFFPPAWELFRFASFYIVYFRLSKWHKKLRATDRAEAWLSGAKEEHDQADLRTLLGFCNLTRSSPANRWRLLHGSQRRIKTRTRGLCAGREPEQEGMEASPLGQFQPQHVWRPGLPSRGYARGLGLDVDLGLFRFCLQIRHAQRLSRRRRTKRAVGAVEPGCRRSLSESPARPDSALLRI